MHNIKILPLWKRRYTITPGAATLLGVAFGCVCAILSAFEPARDFSYRSLLQLSLSFGLFGAISGYMLWLLGDPVRGERLLRIISLVTLIAIVGLLLAFPDFWRQVASSGPLMLVVVLGGVCATVMFAVGAGWGMVHLLGHLTSPFRQSSKPGTDSVGDGIWDRELDLS